MKKYFANNESNAFPERVLLGKKLEISSRSFKVEEHINDNAVFVVYRVRELASDEIFALKHFIIDSQETQNALKEEVEILNKIQRHPNVISLHSISFGMDKNGQSEAFVIMDFYTECLSSFIEKCNFNLEDSQLQNIFLSVCKAVQHLHLQKQPVIHRDIKAQNILRLPNGTWVLSDFSNARLKNNDPKLMNKEEEEEEEEQSEINKITTPVNRAPGMWDVVATQKVDEKADIWALGCLLYLLCNGNLPFTEESQLQVMTERVMFPENRTNRFHDLITQMMNLDPSKRPSIETVIELIETNPDTTQSTAKEISGEDPLDFNGELKALKLAVNDLAKNNQLQWTKLLSLEQIVSSQKYIILGLKNKELESTSVISTNLDDLTECNQSPEKENKNSTTKNRNSPAPLPIRKPTVQAQQQPLGKLTTPLRTPFYLCRNNLYCNNTLMHQMEAP
eukprot:g2073.t1